MPTFPAELWRVSTEIAPSLLLGLAVAGILHVMVKKDRIFRHLGKPGLASTVTAALWGVPLPLCSCGVIPTAMSLRRDGASPGATTAFLVSTPQTGVDSILVTAGMLGWPLAVVKMAAAFVAGLASGVLTDLRDAPPVTAGPSEAESCSVQAGRGVLARFWGHAYGVIFHDLYRWLVFGIVISALLSTFIPADSLAGVAWLHGPWGMLAALAIGIPLYVCSTASVPIAAGLVAAGFPPGAAIVFLMAGPATNAATMGAVRKFLGNRVFWIYVLVIITVSLAAGLLFDGLLSDTPAAGMASHGMHLVPHWLSPAAALLMIAGIAWLAWSDVSALITERRARMSSTSFRLKIGGMSCGSCERRVRDAILSVRGVRAVSVSRQDGTALVDAVAGFDRSQAVAAVTGLGYEASDVG